MWLQRCLSAALTEHIFHRYSSSFQKKNSTIDSGTREHKQKHKYQRFQKKISSSFHYHENEKSWRKRIPWETFPYLNLVPHFALWGVDWWSTKPFHAGTMWFKCGTGTSFVCAASPTMAQGVSILETSQNRSLNKTQGVLLSWGPLRNWQPEAYKITTLMN